MLCRTCGNLLVRGQTICDMCGEAVETNSLSQYGEQAYIARPRKGIKAPKPPINPLTNQVMVAEEQPPVEDGKKSKSKWTLTVSIILASAAILVIGCTILFLKIFGFI